MSAYHLIKGAEALGFTSFGVEGEIENMKPEDLPCIAHVVLHKSYQHFLVLYNIDFKNKKVLLMDPAKGKRIISISEFKLMSSYKYILLKPNKQLPNYIVQKMIFASLINEIKKNYLPIFIILNLSILFSLLNILTAYHFKYLIEYAITFQSVENVIRISIFLLLLFLLKESASLLRNITLLKWSNLFDFHLTHKVFEQIISFPYLYYKSRTTGEILARIKDLGVVKNYIAMLLCVMTAEIISLSFFIILLWNLNKTLAGFSIVFFSFLFLIQIFFQGPLKRKLKKHLRKEEVLNSYLIEAISAFDVVKGLHMEEKFIQTFSGKYQNFLKSYKDFSLLSELEETMKNHLHHGMMILILLYGSRLVILKKMTISELIAFQTLLSYASSSCQALFQFLKKHREYRVSKERVEDLFTIHKETFAMKEYFAFQSLTGDIIIENLTFSYNSSPLLKNIDLKIPYGNKVFICGDSGSGKSTLAKILLRYIEIPYGQVKIKDIDINHYHLDTLRNHITYVSQHEYLFTDTILENIAMGRSLHEDTLEEIIKKFFLQNIIQKTPLGIHSIIEENGFNLSGGERQRLILARSILKNSDIYIFDEASSQIDSKTERLILKNIFELLPNKTIIVISHRSDNKDLFHQMIQMEKGVCHEESF